MFHFSLAEIGREAQNEEVSVSSQNAKDAKKAGKDKKPNPKDKVQEEK